MERNTKQSEYFFYINVNERSLTKNILPHSHEYYEVEICLSGEGIMNINNQSFDIKPNTLFFLTPSDFHSYTIKKDIKLLNLTFPPHCIEYSQIQDLLLLTNYFVTNLDNAINERIIYFIKQIYRECTSPKFISKKYISHLMSCVLIDLLRLERDNKVYGAEDKQLYPLPIQKAIYHLMSNFKEQITLENTAELIGISPGYLSREFNKTVGIGFKDFLVDLRLKHSTQLILYSNESITDIAYYCGFNSTSYFLRAFKKKYGVSPLVYRKNKENS